VLDTHSVWGDPTVFLFPPRESRVRWRALRPFVQKDTLRNNFSFYNHDNFYSRRKEISTRGVHTVKKSKKDPPQSDLEASIRGQYIFHFPKSQLDLGISTRVHMEQRLRRFFLRICEGEEVVSSTNTLEQKVCFLLYRESMIIYELLRKPTISAIETDHIRTI